jgi:8-oxo-dGTP diphosphatase
MYQPIAATLGFILSKDKSSVLMVHRTFRDTDENLGKYNGLGGKLEPNENVADGMIREIKEESGLTVTSMQLRGTVSWPNFGPSQRPWLGFIFLIDGWEGEPFSENEEGTLSWVKISDIPTLPMWEGDAFFIPLVFDGDPRQFHGYMPYDGEHPSGWTVTRI